MTDAPRRAIRSAVVLAAGPGSRLSDTQPGPKCLAPIRRRPILSWVCEALAANDVERVLLVVGHEAALLEEIVARLDLALPLTTVRSDTWELGNGASARAAAAAVDEDEGQLLLMMGDHLVSAEHVARVVRGAAEGAAEGGAIGYLGTCGVGAPDIDPVDATRVRIDDAGTIRAIAKQLDPYNAIDTGVFVYRRGIFDALAEAAAGGGHTLSDGNRILAARAQLRAVDVSGLRWQDVDTADDLDAARANATRILESTLARKQRG